MLSAHAMRTYAARAAAVVGPVKSKAALASPFDMRGVSGASGGAPTSSAPASSAGLPGSTSQSDGPSRPAPQRASVAEPMLQARL